MLKKLRSMLLDNLPFKLFALLFALLLWMYASTRGQSEINFVVPLELKDVPSGMMVVGDSPRPVDVRLLGDEVTIRGLSSNEVGAFISLKGAGVGESLYNLTSANIKAPPSVTITRVGPAEVRIRLDMVTQKQVPVRVKTTGKPQRGFRIKEVRTSPETVQATGPRVEMDKLEEVQTEPVDVAGLSEGFEKQVRLSRQPRSSVTLDASSVKVFVSLEKRR